MDILYFTHPLNGILMVGLPFLIAYLLNRRFHLGWRLFWIGAATFILSQVGHIPFNFLLNQLFVSGVIPTPPPNILHFVLNPIVGGLSAGLWEEGTRTVVYAKWARDARSWSKGVLMGTGHEGGEAIAFGLLVLYTYVQMVALRSTDLARVVPPDQVAALQQQVSAYWSAPIPLSLLGALERLLTFPVQISLSVLVLQAFTRRQWWWVVVAVLWHALVDGAIVFLSALWQGQPWSVYALEGVVAVFAVLSLGIILALRRPEPEPEPTPDSNEPPPGPIELPANIEQDLSSDKLDKTRYS